MPRSFTLRAGLVLAIILSRAVSVSAQATDNKALAVQLFQQGRDLTKDNKWAEACAKFEASLRYDAALGTRLNLAACYEKLGKLASAWALFNESADLAHRAGDTVRHEFALKQIAALLPRLPKLTIAGPTKPPPGFAVTRDGDALSLGVLGTELYVDPGPHEVIATAPGFEQFTATITVDEAQSESVVVRDLTPLKVAPPPQPQPEPPKLRPEPRQTQKLVGIGLVGGGAVLTGIGFFLGARAISANHDAEALCGAVRICENDAEFEKGKALIERARTQATFSTVFVIAGTATAVAGAAAWISAPRRERAKTAILPIMTDRDLGVAVTGRF